MKVLESEIGIPLFVPSGRGIVVTDPGRELYERSARFFSELENLLGRVQNPTADLVRIGSFEVFTTYFMGRLLRDYLPNTKVEIHELVPGRLEEALLAQKIDIGITYEPVPRPKIEYLKVGRVAMGAYTVRDAFNHLPLSEIPFAVPVSPLEGAPSGVKGLDAWPEQRLTRNTAFKVDLLATGLELTRLGLCAIFIPEFVAKLHNESMPAKHQLTPLNLPKGTPTVYREIYLVKRESSLGSAAVKQISNALKEICIHKTNQA